MLLLPLCERVTFAVRAGRALRGQAWCWAEVLRVDGSVYFAWASQLLRERLN